jgi:hypothetical protein
MPLCANYIACTRDGLTKDIKTSSQFLKLILYSLKIDTNCCLNFIIKHSRYPLKLR